MIKKINLPYSNLTIFKQPTDFAIFYHGIATGDSKFIKQFQNNSRVALILSEDWKKENYEDKF